MKMAKDDWLASMLGCNAFRIEIHDDAISTATEDLFAGARSGFYYAKVPTQNVELLNDLARNGFRVVDVNVTLERKPFTERNEFASVPEILVRDYDPGLHA